MKFIDFICQPDNLKKLDQFHCTCFFSENFPLLAFSLWLKDFENKIKQRVERVDLQYSSLNDLKPSLESTFLGQTKFYWLGNFSTLTAVEKKSWKMYLESYSGPNKLMFFAESKDDFIFKNCLRIEVENGIKQAQYEQLSVLLDPRRPSDLFINKLFLQIDSISLDQAMLFLYYQKLLGNRLDDFFEMIAPKILIAEKSLFKLSQAFFGKEGRIFFDLWQKCKDDYSEMFWVAYWSDQIFRATCYVRLSRKKEMLEAKRIGYKLPFLFLQKDWKEFNSKELTNAHDFLYDLDFGLKNGVSEIGLELFYIKFLTGKFA
ncbi:MAG: hypothetical protein UR26_C0002G0106 [candidate division TM6 bacterium GW2011_GWF2_32_72]|nr:MAG: hypothetical protein UR26_C0002G0106 [candidate division TM6 bacterium GW2011_GWF2_32_72]